MLYFAPEIVGKTRRKTPDGFLICLDVPIARIGRMVYTTRDLPKYASAADSGGIIQVDRSADELFRPETVASFEGQSLTNDHPPGVMMTPKYYKLYSVGHMQNVRQGFGRWSDCLLADLFLMDEDAIKQVEDDDKVQISAGYDAGYRMGPLGYLEQYNIVGNHGALVFSGRCGPRCAIGDTAPTLPCGCNAEGCNCKKGKFMSGRPKLKDALLATSASLAEAVKTLDEAPNVENEGGTHVHLHMPGGKDEPAGVGDKRTTDADNNETMTRTLEMLDSISGRLNTMEDVLADFTEDSRMRDARDKRFKDSGETEAEKAEREKKEAAARDKRMRDRRTRDNTPEGGTKDPVQTGDAEETEAEKAEREAKEKAADARHRDGEATPEELEKLKGPTKDAARNSAGLEAEFTRVVELAAIIAPGLATPTFDSNNHVATTAASMCNLRRNALRNALQREDTLAILSPIVDSVKTLDAMPCSAVRIAFNGAAEIVRQRNNNHTGGILSRVMGGGEASSAGKGIKTPKEINEANAKRWAR